MTLDPFAATIEKWVKVSMHRSMRNFLHYVRQSGLSMSHMGAMLHIHRAGKCGVTELGNHLGVTSAAASQMLERLVQLGLILRTEDPDDRRVKQIELTDKGKRFLEDGIRARQSWIDDLLQSLSQDEKETIGVALDTLNSKVRALKQPSEPHT
jgi:DNA-binding MarR family transcriptional regulator